MKILSKDAPTIDRPPERPAQAEIVRICREEGFDHLHACQTIVVVTPPIVALIDEGFEPTRRAGCLHWLVFGDRRRCFCSYYADDESPHRCDHRAPFPCQLGYEAFDHPSAWSHPDGRRVLHGEPYVLEDAERARLMAFARRWALDFSALTFQRRGYLAIDLRLTSRGGTYRLAPYTQLMHELRSRLRAGEITRDEFTYASLHGGLFDGCGGEGR
jgi:hypothetical protein